MTLCSEVQTPYMTCVNTMISLGLLYGHVSYLIYIDNIIFRSSSDNVVKLEHPPKSTSLKKVRFPSPLDNVVKLEQYYKSSFIKEVRFPSPLGNLVKLEHSHK